MSIWRTLGRARSSVSSHGVRSVLTPRRILISIAAVTCTAGVSTSAPSASTESAQAAGCGVGTGGPVIKYPTIYAFGRFCSPVRRTAPATVVLQGRIDGKWTRIAGVSKRLHMLPKKTYILRTTPIHCTVPGRSIRMRTYVALRTGPGRGQTYALANSGIPTTCI